MKVRVVEALLARHGYALVRQRGSHRQYRQSRNRG
jgi:predicted RNA binding protein YcfA (HicA-like mRNA interferase family)